MNPDLSVAEPPELLGRLLAELLFGDELTVMSPTQHWTQRVEAVWGWQPGTINRATGTGAINRATGTGAFPSPLSRCGETTLELAERVVAWCQQHQRQLEKAGRALSRERAWVVQIEQEASVPALLAHPQSRACLWHMARGEKVRTFKITDWVRSRKAITAAKAILQTRHQRQQDRLIVEKARYGHPGYFYGLWLKKLKSRALTVAWEYHRSTHPLFQSKYGTILYGKGGQETEDRERYSKGYHNSFGPARCLNGGVRLDSEGKPTCFILENYRGTEVARLPLKEGS